MPSPVAPELLHAIDRLCKPRRHNEIQPILEPKILSNGSSCPWPVEYELVQVGRQRRTLIEPSLLHQLADAVMSSMGGTSGGATLAHERLIFNAAALTLWGKVTSTVGAWRGLDFLLGTPTLNNPDSAVHALRDWYTNIVRYQNIDEKVLLGRAGIVNQWCREIHAALNPKRELVQAGIACPECGALDYWAEGSLFKHPLVIRYDTAAVDVVESATGHCRACGTDWPARALAWDLEQVALAAKELTQTIAEATLVLPVNMPVE